MIKWDEFYCRFESSDGTVDADTALISLVIDIFKEHAELLVNKRVAACVEVDLLQSTSSLCQVATPLLHQLLPVIVFPSGQSDRAIRMRKQ